MKIGIDASRAFISQRTGIEEYSYQVIKYLRDKLDGHEVILYVRKDDATKGSELSLIKTLPENWKIKAVDFFYLWTQIGLAWEMLLHPVDVLFVPAHTVPWIHPKHTVVTVHGLEFLHCPESYSRFSRWLHNFFIKKSCKWSSRIIAVSSQTKIDVENLYNIPKEKIQVIHNGFEGEQDSSEAAETEKKHRIRIGSKRYILFIGRIETRKNIIGIAKAFEILREKYDYDGRLVLIGKPGHGYEGIKREINKLKNRYEVLELGYLPHEEKIKILKKANVFVFPSFSEGFGIPILEAQSQGVPVITSHIGPMDEVAGNFDILVDPTKEEAIADLANRLMTDKEFREDAVSKGLLNVYRFSWDKSAAEVAGLLLERGKESAKGLPL